MNKKLENIFQKQKKLAAYCLNGKSIASESFYSDNIYHYNRLVSNIFEDSLSSAFPLTRNLLLDEEWNYLVTEFKSKHKCKTPFVWKMPFEFYKYIADRKFELHKKYPFLVELLKFEWYEIKIYMRKDKSIKLNNYLNGEIIINPNHKLIKLQYPVHIKNATLLNERDKGEYYVLLFRENKTYKVIFNDLSILMAAVCEIINIKPLNTEELITFIKSNFVNDLDKNIIERIRTFIDWGVSNQLFFTSIKGSIYV